ncbi:MAG: TetR/AcrR family transcriptional regulator [Acidobacteria bacterium]|nr:TetR/AcrR family transcriptional regulator [Acidobacteriota bacterium]
MIKNLFSCDKSSRMTGDERREQILRTAIELFSRNGFSGTTTKKIAKEAGVSEAMVFRHFVSKDELYKAILHSKVCEDGENQLPWEDNSGLVEAMERNDDFQVFYLFAKRSLEKQQADIEFIRLLFYSGLEQNELTEQFVYEFMSKLYAFFGDYIDKRKKMGAMREVNPRIVVRALMGMLIHHSLNNILWDKKRQLLDISNHEAAENFANLLLKGITK